MGAKLFEKEAIFRDTMTWCSKELEDVLKHRLRYSLSKAKAQRTNFGNNFKRPSLYSARCRLLSNKCLEKNPRVNLMLMGHSLGEYIAACVAV